MKKLILILLILGLVCPGVYAASDVTEESVKAAFIFHFLKFTEWTDNEPNYYVCIPDDEALRTAARQSLKGKIVNGRKVVVNSETEGCHILVSNFIPQSETTTLTIGPLTKGALLEFRTVNNKLKFAANFDKIKESKLKISSQLLKLALLDKNP